MADTNGTTKSATPRTSYEQRLWRLLEDVQARVDLPEGLDKLVTHTLWRDRARPGEPK